MTTAPITPAAPLWPAASRPSGAVVVSGWEEVPGECKTLREWAAEGPIDNGGVLDRMAERINEALVRGVLPSHVAGQRGAGSQGPGAV